MTIFIDTNENMIETSRMIISSHSKNPRYLYQLNTESHSKLLYSKKSIPALERLCDSTKIGEIYPIDPSLMTPKEKKWNIVASTLTIMLMLMCVAYFIVSCFNFSILSGILIFLLSVLITRRRILYHDIQPFFSFSPYNKDRILFNLANRNSSQTRFNIEEYGHNSYYKNYEADYFVSNVYDIEEVFDLLRMKAEVNGYGQSILGDSQGVMKEFTFWVNQYVNGYKKLPPMKNLSVKESKRVVFKHSENYIKGFDLIAEIMKLESDIHSLSQAEKDYNQNNTSSLLSSRLEIDLMNKKLEFNDVKNIANKLNQK